MTRDELKAISKEDIQQLNHLDMCEFISKFLDIDIDIDNDEPPSDQAKLLRILSGLRGPDNNLGGEYEGATTAIIRNVFGLSPYNYSAGMMIAEYDNEFNLNLRREISENTDIRNLIGEHFIIHARLAFTVLGLKWDKVNNLKEIKEKNNGKQQPNETN